MHAVRPSPGRNALTDAAYGPTRRERACGVMRHLAQSRESWPASRTGAISQARPPRMGGALPPVVGLEARAASADRSSSLRCARRHEHA